MNATLTLEPPSWMAPEAITHDRCEDVNAMMDELGENCQTPCGIWCEPSYDVLGAGIRLRVELTDCDPGEMQEAIEALQGALLLAFDTRFE